MPFKEREKNESNWRKCPSRKNVFCKVTTVVCKYKIGEECNQKQHF